MKPIKGDVKIVHSFDCAKDTNEKYDYETVGFNYFVFI